MIGSHTIFSADRIHFKDEKFNYLKHEKWIEVDRLFKDKNVEFLFSHYEGYPFDTCENDRYYILIEGMIYNFSDDVIKNMIKEIALFFCDNQKYHKKITKFIENADGDYIIQIYDKQNKKYILFNDYLGRLPIYYHHSDNQAIISREIKFILEFIDEIIFDKIGLVENLMFGYTLGNKTYFQDIKRLYPCEYIVFEDKGNKYDFKIGNAAEFNFKLKNRFWSKKKSLDKLKTQFFESTKNRVNKLQEKGYKIISDLSGGYDSRAVFGALCKFNKKIDYYTYEYIQDESIVASKLFKSLNSPGEHIKTSFKNEIEYEGISELVYKTNGLVNYYTTGICYNDQMVLKNIASGKIAHFGGFGGEFIRHPEKRWYNSIYRGIKKNIYSRLSIKKACSIIKIDYNTYEKYLSEHLDMYNEVSKNDVLKHYYYEYYLNHVNFAGEDRGRIFNWTIHPMWSKNFITTIFHRIPLKWTGYKYFINFMNVIDERLLNVQIYKSNIDLQNEKSINKFEKEYQKPFSIKVLFYNILNNRCPYLIYLYKKIKGKTIIVKNGEVDNSKLMILFNKYYIKLSKTNVLINKNVVPKYIHETGAKYNRLTTLAMYLYELEKRYLNKIQIEK